MSRIDLRHFVDNVYNELIAYDDALRELEHLRAVDNAVEDISPRLKLGNEDTETVKERIADLEAREDLYRLGRQRERERLLPEFKRLAEIDLTALEEERDKSLHTSFATAQESLVRMYIRRSLRMTRRNNRITADLLRYSEGLPVNDTNQTTLPFPAVATRIGPNEEGEYTGIRVGRHEAHLEDEYEQVASLLKSMQLLLSSIVDTALTDIRDRGVSQTSIPLEPTDFFFP